MRQSFSFVSSRKMRRRVLVLENFAQSEIVDVRHVRRLGPGIMVRPTMRYSSFMTQMVRTVVRPQPGRAPSRLFRATLSGSRISCPYVFARAIIAVAAPPQIFHRGCDESLVDGPLFFPANSACYLRSTKDAADLSGCRQIYCRPVRDYSEMYNQD